MKIYTPRPVPERTPGFFKVKQEFQKDQKISKSTVSIYEEALSKARNAAEAENLLTAAINNNTDTEKSYTTVLDLMSQEKNMQGIEKISLMALKANKLSQNYKEMIIGWYQDKIEAAVQKNNLFHVRIIFNQALEQGFIDLPFLRNILSLNFVNDNSYFEEMALYYSAFNRSNQQDMQLERLQELNEAKKEKWMTQDEYNYKIQHPVNELKAIIEIRYKQIINSVLQKNLFNQLKEIYTQLFKKDFAHLIDFNRFFSMAYKNNDIDFCIDIFKKAQTADKLTKKMRSMMSALFVYQVEQLIYDNDSSQIEIIFKDATALECANSAFFEVLLSHFMYVQKFDRILEIFEVALSQGKTTVETMNKVHAIFSDRLEQAASKDNVVEIKRLCQKYLDLGLSLNTLYTNFCNIFPDEQALHNKIYSVMTEVLEKANKTDDVIRLENYKETQEKLAGEKELIYINCEPRSFKF